MMPSTPTNCVAYVRVSTEHQAGEKLTSLADQETAVRALASRLGADVGLWFRDAGASGATVEGRPAFLELLAWCEAHQRGTTDRGLALVLNDSRFGRFPEPEEATYWRHHLYRLGWIVRFAEGDDVQGDFRSVVRAIGSVQATEYRRNLMANTRRGMAGAASQGFWTREAPYGFRRQVVHPVSATRTLERGQRKVDGEKVRLTPHPDEAVHVRWAFDAYAGGGQSLGTIADELHRRAPGRKWGRTVVSTMLSNPAYRGAVVGGRRRDGESELYGLEEAHEPLVPEQVWQAVQRRLDVNAERGRGVRSHYLLSGLLRCVYCGEPYTGGGGGRSRNARPVRSHRRFYRDNGGVRGTCPGRIGTIMRHLVDDAAVEMIASTVSTPAVRNRIERAVDDAIERGAGGDSDAQLRAAQRRHEQRRERLAAAVADGVLLPAEASRQLEQVRAALAEIDARRQAQKFARRRAQGARTERGQVLDALLDLPRLLERATVPQRREIVEPWLGQATFDKLRRVLSIGIRPVPALPSFQLYAWPGPHGQEEGGLIVRSTSLVQPGHRYRIAEADEAMRGTA